MNQNYLKPKVKVLLTWGHKGQNENFDFMRVGGGRGQCYLQNLIFDSSRVSVSFGFDFTP